MVYLLKMVNLSMAMLNNQMVYHVISSPLKFWLEPRWRHVFWGYPRLETSNLPEIGALRKSWNPWKVTPTFFRHPLMGFIQGNNVSMGPWVSHDYSWPEPFNHIFRGVPLEIPHKNVTAKQHWASLMPASCAGNTAGRKIDLKIWKRFQRKRPVDIF